MALKKIDTISLKRKTGTNSFGENTFGAVETFGGRWNDESKQVVDKEGVEFVSLSSVYYDDETLNMKEGDLIKRDGDFRPVRQVKESRNGSGTRYLFTAFTS